MKPARRHEVLSEVSLSTWVLLAGMALCGTTGCIDFTEALEQACIRQGLTAQCTPLPVCLQDAPLFTYSARPCPKWEATGSMEQSRSGHTLTLLASGEVLALGGSDAESVLSSVELFDPLSGAWSTIQSMAVPRVMHSVTTLKSEKVLIAGGSNGASCLNSVEVYDPSSQSWTEARGLNSPRANHTATVLSSGEVLVAGGSNAEDLLRHSEIFDPETGDWLSIESMIVPREHHSAVLLDASLDVERVFIIGGISKEDPLFGTEVFDPRERKWLPTAGMLEARYGHTATLLLSGKVLVTGGNNGTEILASAEIYDPSNNEWTPAGRMGSSRALHSAVLLPSGKVLVGGGEGPDGLLASAEVYDPDTGMWSPIPSMSTPRQSHAAILLGSGKVLLAGGRSAQALQSAGHVCLAGGWAKGPSLGEAEMYDLSARPRLAAGGLHSLVLQADDALYSWGTNEFGQLADSSAYRNVPARVESLSHVSAIAAGDYHSLALRSDGTLWAWGDNSNGQLGVDNQGGSRLPVRVDLPTGLAVAAVRAGGYASFAIGMDGSVWAWGKGPCGLDVEAASPNSGPVKIAGLPRVKTISVGFDHCLALSSDDEVWAWGKNDQGQLGDGTTADAFKPQLVAGLTGVTAIAAGVSNSFALRGSDGSVWAWGDNSSGELGDGSTAIRTRPVQVQGVGGEGITNIAVGFSYAMALSFEGEGFSWGDNSSGQLGDGTKLGRALPGRINDLPVSTAISSGAYHALALSHEGTVWAWGDNSVGQLGNATSMESLVPQKVEGLTEVEAIAVGEQHSLALREDGTVWVWGSNTAGQIGNDVESPRRRESPLRVGVLKGAVAIVAGDEHSLALRIDGTVWGWGRNSSSSVGNTMADYYSWPRQLEGVNRVTAIAAGSEFSLMLRADGTVWETGESDTGLQQIPGLMGVIAIAAGESHSLALRADGTVWAWGANSEGQLGDGTDTDQEKPVPVHGQDLPRFIAIAAGGQHSLALSDRGTVWSWGDNSWGQLGDGTGTHSRTPVRVKGLNQVIAISAGMSHSLALDAHGAVWAWGDNGDGQLGVGTDKALYPMRISVIGDIEAIVAGSNHSLARQSDGTIYAWGDDEEGQLGNGPDPDSWDPVSINLP